jgi:hypothetical protein
LSVEYLIHGVKGLTLKKQASELVASYYLRSMYPILGVVSRCNRNAKQVRMAPNFFYLSMHNEWVALLKCQWLEGLKTRETDISVRLLLMSSNRRRISRHMSELRNVSEES